MNCLFKQFYIITIVKVWLILCFFGNIELSIGGGLVGYWKLDETSGNTAKDEMGNYDGTLENGASWNSAGMCRGALKIDSAYDKINLGHISQLDSTVYFTINCWLNVESLSDNHILFRIVKEVSLREINMIYIGGSGRLYCGVYVNDYQRGYFDLSSEISVNEWHMITMVFNGNGSTNSEKLKCYIDTTEMSLTYERSPMPTITSDFSDTNAYIGNSASPIRREPKKIDEFRIYNMALSECEIKALYELGDDNYNLTNGLVGYWKFNEGSGSTTYDSSGNGNDGSIDNPGDSVWQDGIDAYGVYGKSNDHTNTYNNITVPHSSQLNLTGEKSFSCWANFNDFPNSGWKSWNFIRKSGKCWESGNTFTYKLGTGSGTDQYLMYHAGCGTKWWYNVDDLINLNEWNHFAVSHGANCGIKFYLNGSLMNVQEADTSGNSTIFNIKIGRYYPDISNQGNAIMDELRLYDRPLTTREVFEIYNLHSTP